MDVKIIPSTICAYVLLLMVSSPHCLAARLGDTVDTLSGMLKIDVFMEEGIENTDVVGVPENAKDIADEELLRRSLNGASYGTLYRGDTIEKLWIYKSGKGSYVRVSSYETQPYPVSTGPRQTNTGFRSPTSSVSVLKHSGTRLNKDITTTRTGYSYKETSFGYKKPVFNTRLVGDAFSAMRNGHARISEGMNVDSGVPGYLERKQAALRDEHRSRSAMMNHVKATSATHKTR